MPAEVETVLHHATRRPYVLSALSLRAYDRTGSMAGTIDGFPLKCGSRVDGFSPNIKANGWVTKFKELKY
ncbi:MAG TPA: hypothetical protein VFR94_11075 [Nitrososphaeraceae archaeon]|nr:hypothetical protein [Nitrososphaeraceae archaeon]